jgi:hypothetical protein
MTRSVRRRLTVTVGGLTLLGLTAACGGGSPATPAAAGSAPPPSVTTPAGGTAPPPVSATSPAGAPSQAPVPVESNPPGDIPDNLAFVPYRNTAGGYRFTYPEGWARKENGTAVTFTDKLNGIEADTAGAPSAPTVDSVRADVVPRLRQAQPAFELRTVEPVTLPAGTGVRLVYRRNSAPDPVTGRQIRDEVESYLVAGGGQSLRLDLFGPVGSDNVDAYRTISRSLALR